jgi:hypothetical protein
MFEKEISNLIRQRVAREIDIYCAREALDYDELSTAILRDREVSVQTFNRNEHRSLSGKALRALAQGQRNTQQRVVNAAKAYLTKKRAFPKKQNRSLVFDVDHNVVELARQQTKFFGLTSLKPEFLKQFCGVYQVFRFEKREEFFIIVDYLAEAKTLLCRGYFIIKERYSPKKTKRIFVSGYGVASPDKFYMFLTDHFRPLAYVLDFPIHDPNPDHPTVPSFSSYISYTIPGEVESDFKFNDEFRDFPWYGDKSLVKFSPHVFPESAAYTFLQTKSLNTMYCDVFSDQKVVISERYDKSRIHGGSKIEILASKDHTIYKDVTYDFVSKKYKIFSNYYKY